MILNSVSSKKFLPIDNLITLNFLFVLNRYLNDLYIFQCRNWQQIVKSVMVVWNIYFCLLILPLKLSLNSFRTSGSYAQTFIQMLLKFTWFLKYSITSIPYTFKNFIFPFNNSRLLLFFNARSIFYDSSLVFCNYLSRPVRFFTMWTFIRIVV